MIAKSIWISLYAILIFGFVFIGAHFVISLDKSRPRVFIELEKELRNPTNKIAYYNKYQKYLERKQSPNPLLTNSDRRF